MSERDPKYFTWSIAQQCPVCRIDIVVRFLDIDIPSVVWLFREIFLLYDEHRCRIWHNAAELRERAERESERLAERADVIRARERAEPPRELPSLYERAERESVLLAERALAFGAQG